MVRKKSRGLQENFIFRKLLLMPKKNLKKWKNAKEKRIKVNVIAPNGQDFCANTGLPEREKLPLLGKINARRRDCRVLTGLPSKCLSKTGKYANELQIDGFPIYFPTVRLYSAPATPVTPVFGGYSAPRSTS